MDTSTHSLNTLFEQLGLPSSDSDIDRFIAEHKTLSDAASLSSADFWTESQSRFLKEAIELDSDWAEVVDELNTRLHG